MHKQTITVIATVLGLITCMPAMANSNGDVFNRNAKGDLTTVGGASRIHGNMAEMYKEQIKLASKKKKKNVILLIGDGMGDSEITAARNFAYGAGGAFPGSGKRLIDKNSCPSSGKERGNAVYYIKHPAFFVIANYAD